jgi:hypothetical protein
MHYRVYPVDEQYRFIVNPNISVSHAVSNAINYTIYSFSFAHVWVPGVKITRPINFLDLIHCLSYTTKGLNNFFKLNSVYAQYQEFCCVTLS